MNIYRPEYNMEVIGKNLRRLREARNLTVDEVREYLRLGSVQAVYKYEKGKSYPQADTMFALMELYGATVGDLVYDFEEDAKASSSGVLRLIFLKVFLRVRHQLHRYCSCEIDRRCNLL